MKKGHQEKIESRLSVRFSDAVLRKIKADDNPLAATIAA
jgi:hypothetical protein